ncbi:MAG: hypothetical protein J6N53_09220 [Lachnospiraceae bacterium]|nr:hypothetical protein [Lachnospiraceae bacterium]
MMNKSKFYMFLCIIVAMMVLTLVLFANSEYANKLRFESYITGVVNEDAIDPLYTIEKEDDIMCIGGESEWLKLLYENNPNTKGFIKDFFCADMLMEQRKVSRGYEETICVVVPQKGEKYEDTVADFIGHKCPVSSKYIRSESIYCGGNEYYDQQRIRILHKNENYFSPDSHFEAYRMIRLNKFIKDGDSIIYMGEMTSGEVRKNFDLLMNEYLNSWELGVFRNVTEDDEYFYYVFYNKGFMDIYNPQDVKLILVAKTYRIDKTNGVVSENIKEFRIDDTGLILYKP